MIAAGSSEVELHNIYRAAGPLTQPRPRRSVSKGKIMQNAVARRTNGMGM